MKTEEILPTQFTFVVDTNQYAGNFERQLCAYITGLVGDCDVGGEYSTLFQQEETTPPFDEVVAYPDDHGCFRPCEIFKDSKGAKYNSVAIHFETRPTASHIEIMKRRAFLFPTALTKYDSSRLGKIKITGFRLIEQTCTHKVESL
jgi:hypothetical protein